MFSRRCICRKRSAASYSERLGRTGLRDDLYIQSGVHLNRFSDSIYRNYSDDPMLYKNLINEVHKLSNDRDFQKTTGDRLKKVPIVSISEAEGENDTLDNPSHAVENFMNNFGLTNDEDLMDASNLDQTGFADNFEDDQIYELHQKIDQLQKGYINENRADVTQQNQRKPLNQSREGSLAFYPNLQLNPYDSAFQTSEYSSSQQGYDVYHNNSNSMDKGPWGMHGSFARNNQRGGYQNYCKADPYYPAHQNYQCYNQGHHVARGASNQGFYEQSDYYYDNAKPAQFTPSNHTFYSDIQQHHSMSPDSSGRIDVKKNMFQSMPDESISKPFDANKTNVDKYKSLLHENGQPVLKVLGLKSSSVTNEVISSLFCNFGNVSRLFFWKQKALTFVEYPTKELASIAKEMLQGLTFFGHQLDVLLLD